MTKTPEEAGAALRKLSPRGWALLIATGAACMAFFIAVTQHFPNLGTVGNFVVGIIALLPFGFVLKLLKLS